MTTAKTGADAAAEARARNPYHRRLEELKARVLAAVRSAPGSYSVEIRRAVGGIVYERVQVALRALVEEGLVVDRWRFNKADGGRIKLYFPRDGREA